MIPVVKSLTGEAREISLQLPLLYLRQVWQVLQIFEHSPRTLLLAEDLVKVWLFLLFVPGDVSSNLTNFIPHTRVLLTTGGRVVSHVILSSFFHFSTRYLSDSNVVSPLVTLCHDQHLDWTPRIIGLHHGHLSTPVSTQIT